MLVQFTLQIPILFRFILVRYKSEEKISLPQEVIDWFHIPAERSR